MGKWVVKEVSGVVHEVSSATKEAVLDISGIDIDTMKEKLRQRLETEAQLVRGLDETARALEMLKTKVATIES